MQAILLNNKSADILDLYNVDYVCKVEIVDGQYRIERLEDEISTDPDPL